MSLRRRAVGRLVAIVAMLSLSFAAGAQQPTKPATAPTKPATTPAKPAPTPQTYDFGRIPTDPVPGQVITGFRHKKNLTALPEKRITPKKTVAGWPDLQGTWSNGDYIGVPGHSVETGFDPAGDQIEGFDPPSTTGGVGWSGNILIDPMKGVIPYRPAAQGKHMELLAKLYAPTKRMDQEPTDLCFPGGVPHDTFGGGEIRYIPGAVVFLRPKNTQIIPMDDRPRLSEEITLFMGDSRAHFEDDTLVVETRNNRDSTWFDVHGTFHSSAMRVIERYTLVDEKTMYHEIAIDDPTVFTKVWKMATTFDRGKFDTEPRENQCHESERDMDAITRQGIRANAAGLKGYHIHLDLKTGKALRPEEQPYLDRGQIPFHSFAPAIPDEMLVGKTCDGCPLKPAAAPKATPKAKTTAAPKAK